MGKSALFNRLVGRREAIVDDQPGVTRDVKGVRMEREETGPLLLLDTGGLWSGDRWEKDIQKKVAAALEDVDLVLFCVDGRSGLTAGDLQVAGWLREGGYEALLVATKLDDPNHEETADFFELYSLGLGEPLPTSAEHNRGIYELLDEIALRLPPEDDSVDEEAVRVAVIGRPNVGKSSIVNAIVGDEKVIVADVPGTTRDAVDVHFEFGGRPFVIVDTAGIRRKPAEDLEFYSKLRSERALLSADVAVLVIDPFELGDHELRLANLALEGGKPVVVAVNKWDLVSDEQLREVEEEIDAALGHIAFAPKVYTSAINDYGLHELLATVIRVYETARKRIPTGQMNAWIQVWTTRQAPPNFKGKPLKIFYATQADIAPPTFILSVNNEGFITRAYEQYLRNRMREDLGFSEVPFRLIFKSRAKDGGKRVRL